MKILILCMTLTFSLPICNAQGVFKLKEARNIAGTFSSSIKGLWQNISLHIPEIYAGEFDRSSVTFLKKKFDIKLAIDPLGEKDENKVICNSSKGKLSADPNQKGKLNYYYYKFKDFLTPSQLMAQLYRENRSWAIISKSYKGKRNSFDKSHYMLIMKNGREKRTFKNNRLADNTTGVPVYFIKA